MSSVNDQTFEVDIKFTVQNMGADIKSRDVAKAIVKALDTLSLDLDYGDADIRVSLVDDDIVDEFGGEDNG